MSDSKLPSGWSRVKFGDVASRVNESVMPTPDQSRLYIGLEHMRADSHKITEWGSEVNLDVAKTPILKGDVLFARRNTRLRRCAIAPFDTIFSPDGYAIRTKDPSVLLQSFLLYVVASEGFMNFAVENSAGTHSKRVKWSALERYEFALPPIDEQQKIVEVLAASGAIEEAERKALLDSDYEVSALLHSIAENGEPTTLGVLAGGGIQIGPFGSQLHAADYSTDGVPVLMPADLRQRGFDNSAIRRVSECKAQELSNHRLQEGDIVLPRRGELNKRAIISAAEAGWLCGTGSVRVRLQDPKLAPLVLEILAFRESVQWLIENAVGTTMPNLNRDIVARIPLRLPPQESRVLWVKRLTAARVLSEALTHSVSTSILRTASLREALLEFDHV